MSDQPQAPGWWQASDGKWYPPQPPATTPRTSGYAIASVVCAAVSLLVYPLLVFQVLAVAFGHLALRQIGTAPTEKRGRGVAITGLVIGYLLTAGAIFFWLYVLWLEPLLYVE